MGSTWRAPLSNLNFFVAFPRFMMPDAWLFNRFFIHLMNVLPNPYLFKAKVRN